MATAPSYSYSPIPHHEYTRNNIAADVLNSHSVEINEQMWELKIKKDSVIHNCCLCHTKLALVNFCGKLEHSICDPCSNTIGKKCLDCPKVLQAMIVKSDIDELIKEALEHLKLSCVKCKEAVKYTDIDIHLRDCSRRAQEEIDLSLALAIQLQFSDEPEPSGSPSRTADEITTVTPTNDDCVYDEELALGLQLTDMQQTEPDEVPPTAPPFVQIAQQVPPTYQQRGASCQPPPPTYEQAVADAAEEQSRKNTPEAKHDRRDIIATPTTKTKPSIKSTQRNCIIS